MRPALYLSIEDYFLSPQNTVTVEKRNNQDTFPLHHHQFNEIVIVSAGNGIHSWNNQTHTITCGDVLYINNNDVHSYQSVNNLHLDNILYQRDKLVLSAVIEQYLPSQQACEHDRFWRVHSSQLKALSLLTEQIKMESQKSNPASIHLSECLLLQFVILLHRLRYQSSSTIPEPTHQLDVLFSALLQHGCIEPFNIELFCKQHNISARSLTRTFKSQTGMTISEYLQKLKLSRAMNLLRNTQCSISDVASQCGYDDSNYFSSAFKKIFKQTPSEYRGKFLKK